MNPPVYDTMEKSPQKDTTNKCHVYSWNQQFLSQKVLKELESTEAHIEFPLK